MTFTTTQCIAWGSTELRSGCCWTLCCTMTHGGSAANANNWLEYDK